MMRQDKEDKSQLEVCRRGPEAAAPAKMASQPDGSEVESSGTDGRTAALGGIGLAQGLVLAGSVGALLERRQLGALLLAA
jgi:hypothetical protein